MATRAQESERRLRDAYPPLFRSLGISEKDVESIMTDYDDPVVRTTRPVSRAFLLEEERRHRARQRAKGRGR